ncbi:MAG: NAD(P)-dependent oxidoreductase [Cyanobacteria bacterium HKST-UBA01]|nr:NAD(P)-dependent oxidoreductase [Cyanobacteria bacterium HKST-UBA01]
MTEFKGKTIVITGSSRGIGLAIGERLAQAGANIVITGKTVEAHPKLPGTIHTAAEAIEAAGGSALAIALDLRNAEDIERMVEATITTFGGIDILVNNASAISLTPTAKTDVKRYDLMHQVNARGTFLASKFCLPHLEKGKNPHILNISPPLNMNPRWFGPHVAYTMAKYGMSMCTLGMAAEFKESKIAVNSLWPETGIATSAVRNLLGGDQAMKHCRKPDIMADAAYFILKREGAENTGNFYIDSEVLKEEGIDDLSKYSEGPQSELMRDFFLD